MYSPTAYLFEVIYMRVELKEKSQEAQKLMTSSKEKEKKV
jgi:hypothetical protein